jgi:hypothetical protein
MTIKQDLEQLHLDNIDLQNHNRGVTRELRDYIDNCYDRIDELEKTIRNHEKKKLHLKKPDWLLLIASIVCFSAIYTANIAIHDCFIKGALSALAFITGLIFAYGSITNNEEEADNT